MTEPGMTNLEALAEMREMARAASDGPFIHGSSPDDPGAFAAKCHERTLAHGDAVPNTWGVFTPDPPGTTDGLTIAITGNGPHSEANAALVAHILTNIDWLLDLAETGAKELAR